ncbi:hypothetical protein WISP_54941 [Willisornis vidua]|uniref:Uncharacterized protein n=1 Tax=Willisornis vidua TaxID=1566151 RepID=A0ABQ9DFB1_9PASS|nr:hypothetical protein WISP_54941 [Willisornis vidua]
MGAWAAGELESKLEPLYQPANQTEHRPVANQAASNRIRHLAMGRMVEAVRKLGAGQPASWAGASRVLASWFKLNLVPGDCSYNSTYIILYAWERFSSIYDNLKEKQMADTAAFLQ